MKQGIRLALLTALISGISIFANGIFVSKTDPLVFAFVRNSVVALICTLLLFANSSAKHLRDLSMKQWGMLVLIGIVGGGIPFALFFTGIAQIGAVSGNIIQKSLFLWVALLAVPLLGERIRRIQIVGYMCILFGMFYFGGSATFILKQGTWLVLAATLLWSAEQIIAKKTLESVSPAIVAWGRMIFGLPMLLLAVLYMGKANTLLLPSTYSLIPLLLSSVLLTAYMTAWYSALSKAPAVLVSSVLVAAPVITAMLTRFVLQKPFKDGQMLSYGLIVAGVVCILSEYKKHHRAETA